MGDIVDVFEKHGKKNLEGGGKHPPPMWIRVKVGTEGQIIDFFSYTFLEITKISQTKITKSQINNLQKAKKNHKSLRNYSKITQKVTKKSLKSLKTHRRKSCDFKIKQVTYAILTIDLPLGANFLLAHPVLWRSNIVKKTEPL